MKMPFWVAYASGESGGSVARRPRPRCKGPYGGPGRREVHGTQPYGHRAHALRHPAAPAGAKIVEDARVSQRAIVRKEDVEIVATPRGFRTGCYIGSTATVRHADRRLRPRSRPGCRLDDPPALVGCGDAASTVTAGPKSTACATTTSRGTGLHPGLVVAPSGERRRETARFITFGTEPQASVCGAAFIEDAGRPHSRRCPRRRLTAAVVGADAYARRMRRLDEHWKPIASGRIHVAYEDLTLLVNPKGTRSTFMSTSSSAARRPV